MWQLLYIKFPVPLQEWLFESNHPVTIELQMKLTIDVDYNGKYLYRHMQLEFHTVYAHTCILSLTPVYVQVWTATFSVTLY